MRKAFLTATLASLVISAGVGIYIFLFGDFGRTQQRLLLTTLAVGGFSLTGLASTVRSSTWWLWPLRPVGLSTSVVALGVAVFLIWEIGDSSEMLWKAFTTLGVIAVTSGHVGLLATYVPRNTTGWVWRGVAMLIAVGVAYLIIGAVWGQIDADQKEFYLRWLGVAAILDVLGTIGLYPVSRLVGVTRSNASKRGSTPKRPPAKRRLSPSRR